MTTLSGTILWIGDTQTVSDKFKKREFAIRVDDNGFEQKILLQVTQDRCAVLDKYSIGQFVNASINIKGREWTGKDGVTKYFNTLEAWKITHDLPATAQAVVDRIDTVAPSNDLPF